MPASRRRSRHRLEPALPRQQSAMDACRAKADTPSENRVWGFFCDPPSRTLSTSVKTQCSRPENRPTPTTTASGVRFYGYRYYKPDLGRWVNRDPIEELRIKDNRWSSRSSYIRERNQRTRNYEFRIGGTADHSLYAFVDNKPTYNNDFLGLLSQGERISVPCDTPRRFRRNAGYIQILTYDFWDEDNVENPVNPPGYITVALRAEFYERRKCCCMNKPNPKFAWVSKVVADTHPPPGKTPPYYDSQRADQLYEEPFNAGSFTGLFSDYTGSYKVRIRNDGPVITSFRTCLVCVSRQDELAGESVYYEWRELACFEWGFTHSYDEGTGAYNTQLE